MSDTPTPPAGGPEGGAAAGDPTDETPWYSKPTTWIVLVLLLVALVAVFVLSSDDDDSSDVATPASSTSTSISSTTSSSVPASTTSTSTPESTTTSTTEGTDTGETPGVTPVAITESQVKGTLTYYPGSEGQVPFEDGGVEANWYTWDGQFVVAYAGWDATTGDPQCPGNSLEISPQSFDFISNSPSGDGGCDPEDTFPNLVSGDEGARVCEGLVLYRTIIPVEGDDGTPTAGNLYGSIERAVEGGFVGATSMAPVDSGSIGELDFTADAYTVPEGWLADGKTAVTC